MEARTYKISLPEYNIRSMPAHGEVGKKIDTLLKKHFLNQKLAIRALSSAEHKGKSANDLIRITKKFGTDRYSPKRKGQKYGNKGNKHIDFFALERTVTPKAKIMWQFIWSFYHFPKQWGIRPHKIDLVILYDRKQLKSVRYTEDGKSYKRDGFVFKKSDDKFSALKGFIKIL